MTGLSFGESALLISVDDVLHTPTADAADEASELFVVRGGQDDGLDHQLLGLAKDLI